MADTVYETTIANYGTVIGALSENTPDTPYTVRITDIENLTNSNLRNAINNAGRYVNIKWTEGSVWTGVIASDMFYDCASLTSIDTSPFTNVTSANYMFGNCTGLTSIDTSPFTNVTNASNMFSNCTGLTEIDISPFIRVTNVKNMFKDCTALVGIKYNENTESDSMTSYINSLEGITKTVNPDPKLGVRTNTLPSVLEALKPNTKTTPYHIHIYDPGNITAGLKLNV